MDQNPDSPHPLNQPNNAILIKNIIFMQNADKESLAVPFFSIFCTVRLHLRKPPGYFSSNSGQQSAGILLKKRRSRSACARVFPVAIISIFFEIKFCMF